MKNVSEDITDYLIKSKAEKCVLFSDFDIRYEAIELSDKVQTYWFCFEQDYRYHDIDSFKGFMFQTQDLSDIALGLNLISEYRFETIKRMKGKELIKK